ncbi:phospholipase D-like domain-containing protein [Xanthobacter sp. VNH20]|uniref:phospholipase D-like domain-containing protein n=1 Tax=Xanthobacter sp. VNH20 TaxID=3156616 RepID=UPI0032B3F126
MSGRREERAAEGVRDPAPPRPRPAPAEPHAPVLLEKYNCSCIANANAAKILIDGAAYFAQLEAALRTAQRSILIIGWDFDGRVQLRRDDGACPAIGDLLRALVEERPELNVRILVWSSAVVHAPSAPSELLFGGAWQDHPRIDLRLDTTHPIYGAHHQKVVCIDGARAFVGGMDITIDRWDTPAHIVDDPRRRSPGGTPYPPVHDVQMVLDGDAARAVCAIASKRWAGATGEEVSSPRDESGASPSAVEAPEATDFRDVSIGFSRVLPAWNGRTPVSEGPRLTADMLRAARTSIFIEAQYLTAAFVADILEQRLMEPDGPEIVAIVSRVTHTKLERFIMGENRDRLIRRLSQADRHDRFRAYHPVVSDGISEHSVLIHSKIIIIDDRLLRIGSSNLNNRSIGLDSELDAVIEAKDAATRAGVAAVRDRLLAEHLDATPEQVADLLAQDGSLVRMINQLNIGARGLRPFDAMDTKGAIRPTALTKLLDPPRPFEPNWLLKHRRHAVRRAPSSR